MVLAPVPPQPLIDGESKAGDAAHGDMFNTGALRLHAAHRPGPKDVVPICVGHVCSFSQKSEMDRGRPRLGYLGSLGHNNERIGVYFLRRPFADI